MPKAAVLDPQGVAIRNTLHQLGLPGASSVRAGKVMEIELDPASGDRPALEAKLKELCRDFLSKNDGSLLIESERGKGSTFSFTLPVAGNE